MEVNEKAYYLTMALFFIRHGFVESFALEFYCKSDFRVSIKWATKSSSSTVMLNEY